MEQIQSVLYMSAKASLQPVNGQYLLFLSRATWQITLHQQKRIYLPKPTIAVTGLIINSFPEKKTPEKNLPVVLESTGKQ